MRSTPNRSPLHTALLAIATTAFTAQLLAISYSDWQGANFTEAQLNDPAVSEVGADPDNDGVKNLQEFVFFGNPVVSENNLLPTAILVNGTMAFTYRERHNLQNVEIRLQGSNTLMGWITYNTVVEADREAFTDYDVVTLLDPEAFNNSRRFLRLRLELTPVVALRAPFQLSLATDSASVWTVAWTDPNTTEAGYAVERLDITTGQWERLATLSADIGTWQHTAANYQTSTTYRVVAIGSDASEIASDPITLPDTDGDGIPDALELGSSYTGLTGTYASEPNVFSSNGSGVSDGWLAANGFDPAAAFDGNADTDGDGLTDAEEARRGTDPRDMDGDTDNDGVPDINDGWALNPWITTPPLPEVHYAVIRLQTVGWPTGIPVGELDDKGDVLSQQRPDGNKWNYRFWKASTQTTETTPWSFSYGGYPYIPPMPQKRLGRNGHVIGFIDSNNDSSRQAAFWMAGDAAPTLLDDTSLNTENVQFYGSFATAVDGAGNILGYGAQDLHPAADGEYSEFSYGFRHGGLKFQSEQASWVANQTLLTIWYEAGPVSPSAQGVAYYPIAINENGLIAARRDSTPDPADPYTSVYTSGVIEPNNTFHALGEDVICAITSSTPAVVLGYDWWAHANPSSGQWEREPLKVWNPTTQKLVAPTVATQRINDKLEILSGDHIIRNGIIRPLSDFLPSGWSAIYARDINNHGVILAEATRTLDDQGLPITNPQSEPVLLLPFNVYVDADNTTIENYPDLSKGDCGSSEEIEKNSDDEDTYPGVRVYANLVDADDDGVPGYADGIDKFENGEANSCWKFEPILIDSSSLSAFPNAKFKFTYSASDPNQMTRDSSGHYILPEDKVLRIWKKDGDEIREPQSIDQGGDFIKPDQEFTAEQLGWQAGDATIRLYIEVVEARSNESFPIEVEFYPIGTGHPENIGKQKVKVRPYYISQENLGSNNEDI